MPSLAQTLPTNDIGFLRIVASLWGLELASSDPAEAAVELAEGLCDAELLEEVVSTLPADGRSALETLALEDGRMPWVVFARRFGELREMGPGKRDREQPHLQPSSATEILWYRALLAKAFFNTEKGPQEFAFIPDDLCMALNFAGLVSVPEQEQSGDDYPDNPESAAETPFAGKSPALPMGNEEFLGRPASPAEKVVQLLASDRILDDACTCLAALRMNLEPPAMRVPMPVLNEFLLAANLIKPSALKPEAVKSFLEAPRERALEILQMGWQSSPDFNELRQLPGLIFEGEFDNQPLVTREFLLELLEPLPDGQWWSLAAFVRDVKTRYPDYQRPAGDYDSWFIKRESDGVFLRGFGSWDEVDGELIRYFICGPLHWLGLLDLACPAEGAAPTAFRAHVEPRRSGSATSPSAEPVKLNVNSQGVIMVPRLASLAVRYQIARFCHWDTAKDQEYSYRVTAGSLKQAREQGLKAEHLLGLLRKNVSTPLPPPFVKALQRWEQNGSEARVEQLVVLKVSKPEVLNELRTSKAGRFLGEIIGPTTVVIQPGAQARVMAALAELGILAEGQLQDEQL
jgi:Helicase conserved C-terminal domain